ncbi:hypothetical protein [Ancylothrix sp. D3o]|uniref:hypothetical protein n=1 Tax=Ancylothrix sp. D3o TaxID=2953691 RepID=UPI0021BB0E2A|nr:hypothetical protein [Ancylothrix sp. D3o]
MPRCKTEASAHLEMYKLLVEKQRLQQELETIAQRQIQIDQRLTGIQQEISRLEISLPEPPKNSPQTSPQTPPATHNFKTFLLEY